VSVRISGLDGCGNRRGSGPSGRALPALGSMRHLYPSPMRPVITAAEVARLDAGSPVPEEALMERAGLAVAIAAARMGAAYGSRVIVLAGSGNNGGDGYVAARHLRERGVDVAVRSLGYPKGDSSVRRAMAIAAARRGVPMADLGEPEPCDLIIDALFGVGFHGSLPPSVIPWLGHPAQVLAVDVPSGLDATTGEAEAAFRAGVTVTFHALKTGQLVGAGPEVCGRIEVADIGLAGERAEWLLCEDSDAVVPGRSHLAHKWAAGSVAVVGGSPGLVGAAMLTARASLAFGAGAVRALVPGSLRSEAAAMDPGVMTAGCGAGEEHDDPEAILAEADRFDVMAVGPGLGQAGGGLVTYLIHRWDRPIVLDAGALGAVTVDALAARSGPTVITPHAGEFERLSGEPASAEAAARLASSTGAVVLLKGSPTFVMGSERWVITSGGPELASIGTGDVLTGMVGALIGRGMSPESAARAAAHRHGRAGASLAKVTSVTASGLLHEIGRFAW
jgi:ADP-dependent NAD(P)H-hydrate dehydratase / NAD(P)H-hydrate epimerase